MIILGLTHPVSMNNAACILVDGNLVAFVEEERLNRIKHAPHMAPTLAIHYCLTTAGVTAADVDVVAIGFDSAFNAARGALNTGSVVPGVQMASHWLREISSKDKLLPLADFPRADVMYVNHHLSHAASAFYPSSFDQANIMSLDGSGGGESGVLATGSGADIKILRTIPNRSSWGVMYEEITDRLGFRRHSGEGKVMGLAAYGKPDPALLPFVDWNREVPGIDSQKFRDFLDAIPRRSKDDPLTDYHNNLAATLQATLEQVGMRMAEWMHTQTGLRNLCLAGGSALNCSMNGKLALLPFVDDIFIQPAAHDSGTALGAALVAHREKTGVRAAWRMVHAYWGPEYGNDEIEAVLKATPGIRYERCADIFVRTAEALNAGKIVGWFQGRSEVGPRALGARSILANPSIAGMKDMVNNRVKHREPWRPFAPSMLEEATARYFDNPMPSPFMILAFDVRGEHAAELVSATHVDGTCRPQTVSKTTNPRYWRMIDAFRQISGIPAVLNTSFNVDAEPIVNSPADAVKTYLSCAIDVLAIGDFYVEKIQASG
jgi:carbamoyltransferase